MPVFREATIQDLETIHSLLKEASLPIAGVETETMHLYVAEQDRVMLGAVGFEQYGNVALARSLVVTPSARGTGLGGHLVRHLFTEIARRDIGDLYILTTTAEAFATHFGFQVIHREAVDPRVTASVEFRGACPESAVLMVRRTIAPEAPGWEMERRFD